MIRTIGSSLRGELKVLAEAIAQTNEKWVREEDPSMSVTAFIEKASSALNRIKAAHSDSLPSRDKEIDQVRPMIAEIESACASLKAAFDAVRRSGEPEDDNKVLKQQ